MRLMVCARVERPRWEMRVVFFSLLLSPGNGLEMDRLISRMGDGTAAGRRQRGDGQKVRSSSDGVLRKKAESPRRRRGRGRYDREMGGWEGGRMEDGGAEIAMAGLQVLQVPLEPVACSSLLLASSQLGLASNNPQLGLWRTKRKDETREGSLFK